MSIIDNIGNLPSTEPEEVYAFPDAAAIARMGEAPEAPITPGSAARDLTVILELDREALARAVYRLNGEETQRVGARLTGGEG